MPCRAKTLIVYHQMRLRPLVIALLAATTLEGQPSAPEGPFRIGGGVSAPTVTYKVEPSYTQDALNSGVQGEVALRLVVGRDGVPTDIRVMRPLGHGLDENAVQAVRQWRFNPGEKNGQPVPVISMVTMNFQLPASGQVVQVDQYSRQGTPRRDIPNAGWRPSDVTWLDAAPGKYELTTTIESVFPVKLSDLDIWGGEKLTPEQKAKLDELSDGKTKTTTNVRVSCLTTEALNSRYYFHDPNRASCKKTITKSTSTQREMTLQCAEDGGTFEGRLYFEVRGSDNFTVSEQNTTMTHGIVTSTRRTTTNAKWVAADCGTATSKPR